MQGETYDKNRIAFKFFDTVILQLMSDDQRRKCARKRTEKERRRIKWSKVKDTRHLLVYCYGMLNYIQDIINHSNSSEGHGFISISHSLALVFCQYYMRNMHNVSHRNIKSKRQWEKNWWDYAARTMFIVAFQHIKQHIWIKTLVWTLHSPFLVYLAARSAARSIFKYVEEI